MTLPDAVVVDVPGIEDQVEILVDEWGVPHIYAASQHDVFVAQGFNAARDRLFQIDLWRRRGLGLLSEVFGEEYLEQDRAARLFLYRGDMRAEWLAYGTDTKQVATAFVAGVNAFVALTADDPALLPPEFTELGYRPTFWEPEDVARIRSHGLFYNLEQEVERARTLRDFGPELEDLRQLREPAHQLRVPEGLDLSLIPDDVLRVYRLATAPADLSASPAAAADEPSTAPQGSNNWVIGAEHSATGRPLLANDPHRVVSLPALRYISHLVAPGLDAIGAGEPALPGISIGHNGQVAFGLTIFAIDQEDLYVYRTNPDRPHEYWYEDRWVPMAEVIESVPVAGGGTREVTLHFTRHGPVIYEDAEREVAFAVRAAWLEPGTAPYLGSMEYMRAPSPDAFVSAMNRWGSPGENQVYAAPDGTIGWKPAGLVPIRPNWDGTLPVPGDGRYEWAGFYDGDQLPSQHRPAQGWFATANQMNLPEDFPAERAITYDWYAGVRHERIVERLSEHTRWTVEECVALQNDYVSLPARRIVDVLRTVTDVPVDIADDVALLLNWDADLGAGSAAGALFEVWYQRHLRPALLRRAVEQVVPAEQVETALAHIIPDTSMASDPRVDLDLLTDPGGRLGPDPAAAVREVLVDSVRAAGRDVRERLGDEPAAWRWGDLHHAYLKHPQAAALGEAHRDWTAVGPVARGGSGDTVGCTTYSPDFRQTVGASFRVAIDVGEWDSSVAVNSPGQSGVPTSPHFRDHFDRWAADGSFPLVYSREKVEAHCGQRIVLQPRTAAGGSAS